MPDSFLHGALLVAVIALVTLALRVLPFLVFGGRRKVPDYILYLGRVLPCAIMGMLIVYCLRHISFRTVSGFLPEAVSVLLVVCLHVRFRNTLLSILGGTLCCMALVQLVFV